MVWVSQTACWFPLHGPTPHSQSALVMKGFCSAVFGTTMEQCTDYIYFIKRASNISRETPTRGGSRTLWCLYELILVQFFARYITERLLGRSFCCFGKSEENIFQICFITPQDYHAAIKMLFICLHWKRIDV